MLLHTEGTQCLQEVSHILLVGREDMDVTMLGSGRPFVLEIANARARMPPPECFDSMAASLNESGVGVEVRKLQPVNRDTLKLIKVCPFTSLPCMPYWCTYCTMEG